MEIKVIKETKEEIELEVVGEDHTLCNALREALNQHTGVVVASYKIEHPLLTNPKIYLRVKEMPIPKGKERMVPLDEIKGVGPKRVEQLEKAGIKSANDLLKMNVEKVAKKSEIPESVLEKFLEQAKTVDFSTESAPRRVLKEVLKGLKKTFGEIREQFGEAVA